MENEEKDTSTAQEGEKKKLTERQVFWLRFTAWAIFALVLPAVFIIWRFDLFTKVTYTQYSAWTILLVIFIAAFAISCLRYATKALVGWSMAKQCMEGILRIVIPLACLCYIVYVLNRKLIASGEDLGNLLQALGVVTGSEAIAIPFNPWPEYLYKQTKGEVTSLIDYAIDTFKRNKEGDGK